MFPNTELFLPGLLSVVELALLGWEFFFLIALFSSWLELRCRALRSYWLFVGCGAGLVGAVLDRTLGVSNSVGSIWESIGYSGNGDAYFVFWLNGAPRENGRPKDYKTLFHLFFFFVFLLFFGKSYLFL